MFDLILFDLGGVVVELTGVGTMIEWSGGGITSEEVWRRWLRCEAVRAFESGRSTVERFGREAVAELGLSVSPEEFLQGFASWIGGVYDGTHETIAGLRGKAAVACLSNTNAIHWETMTVKFGLHTLFDQHFLSHELGMLKPDREIFEHIPAALGLQPERILFFDDNRINVEGARSVGMRGHHVAGMSEARAVLHELGLLAATEEKNFSDRQ